MGKEFISPRNIPWLYDLIVTNDIEVTIKPCKGDKSVVDITISKTATPTKSSKFKYSTTIKDFLDTETPFFNQHNAVEYLVRKVEEWSKKEQENFDRVEEIVKREHQ